MTNNYQTSGRRAHRTGRVTPKKARLAPELAGQEARFSLPETVALAVAELAGELEEGLLAFAVGGRQVQVSRPRLRSADRKSEVQLPTYQAVSSTELLGRQAVDKMLAKLSTRRYRTGLEPVGAAVEARSRGTGMDSGGVPDFPQEGTLEDLQVAAITSRLSEDEMETIVTEVLVLEAGTRLLAEVLTDDGQLRTG